DGISPEIPEGERKGRAVRWKSKRAARGVFLRTREMIGKGMKTADFKGELTPNGHIAVPPDIVALVPPGKQILVALQWGISEDDSAWRAAGRRQFEAAYAPADSIYESLIHDTSSRMPATISPRLRSSVSNSVAAVCSAAATIMLSQKDSFQVSRISDARITVAGVMGE